MTSSAVTIDTADGPMPVICSEPSGAARGGVIVVQEAFGVTPYIEDVTRRLAAVGWLAIAPSLFHRQGSPVIAYDDLPQVMEVVAHLNAGGITTDMAAALTHLEAAGIPASRIGVVGFCMGGTVALYAATVHRLGAAVTFYGGGVAEGRFGLPSLVDLAPSLGTPWLGLYGDLDKGIPVDQVEDLRRAAAQAHVPTEIVRYPEGDHGFHCNDRPAVFNAEAAAHAWEETLAWFDRNISG